MFSGQIVSSGLTLTGTGQAGTPSYTRSFSPDTSQKLTSLYAESRVKSAYKESYAS